MIQSIANAATRQVWERRRHGALGYDLQRAAYRKLLILDAAVNISDLRSPPGNRLEKLSGSRAGQHSIRVNQQWRICFVWTPAGPDSVEIVDYH